MTALTPLADIREGVDAYLAEYLDVEQAAAENLGPSGADLIRELRPMLAKGKRTRAALCWWGHEIAAGAAGEEVAARDPRGIVAAAAGVEMFHAAALVHDDIIDHSKARRGLPTTHVRMTARHRDRGLQGAAEDFGIATAIIAGDLCLGISEDLFDGCVLAEGSPDVTRIRREMRRDVMVGQYLDVLAQAEPGEPRRIQERAWHVLTLKSARYSVEQPLLLGAALARAPQPILEALSALGLPLGQGYQLRDDLLGVFGDPAVTGKPAGDDLREGKRTLLLGYVLEAAGAAEAAELASGIGSTNADVGRLREIIEATGAPVRIEGEIADLVERSGEGERALLAAGARPDQVREFVDFARSLTSRTS